MITRQEILVGFIKDKYFILSVNNKAAKIITNTATIKYLIIKQFLQLVIFLHLLYSHLSDLYNINNNKKKYKQLKY